MQMQAVEITRLPCREVEEAGAEERFLKGLPSP